MKTIDYLDLKTKLLELGYEKEIDWAEDIELCKNENSFANEAMWVILNSGMKNQIARKIEERIYHAIKLHQPIGSVFGHKGKVKAIEYIFTNKKELFKDFQEAKNKLEFLVSLPWIGNITKYHLAKNLGIDICKPDRHLVRIADKFGTTPFKLCAKLSKITGDRVRTIDTVLWRAANLGII